MLTDQTSPSERLTVRLSRRSMRQLRVLAYEFMNAPSSLATIYVEAGIREAARRSAALRGQGVSEFWAESERAYDLAVRLSMPGPSPEGEAHA